jgi:hypothetical protein
MAHFSLRLQLHLNDLVVLFHRLPLLVIVAIQAIIHTVFPDPILAVIVMAIFLNVKLHFGLFRVQRLWSFVHSFGL